MRLLDAYTHPVAKELLLRLLSEREPKHNISHAKMPTWAEHSAFVDAKPYPHWYLIDCGDMVGATYLTDRREIGIGILRQFRGHGYGRSAVLQLMAAHPGKFLANVNPTNRSSIEMFSDLGFRHLQSTYAL